MKNHISVFHIFYFLFWTGFCLATSRFDWDIVHTLMEIDIRVFFEELGVQKWSYQFNGGMTRYKNLGTHHQSPWFLIFLTFGSYWGVKLLIPFVMTISNILFVKYLKEKLKISLGLAFTFSAIFSLNGYWLLHSYHGHITYCAQYLFIVSFIYFLDYLENDGKQNLLIGALCFFGTYSLSIYQTLTYMAIPSVLGIILWLIFLIVKKLRDRMFYLRLIHIFASCFFICLLYVPKIMSALSYLKENQRSNNYIETRTFLDLIFSLFVPAKSAVEPFFNWPLSPPWGVHEYSYFSLSFYWIIFLGLIILFKRIKINKEICFGKCFLGLFVFITSLLLYLGDFISFSPFRVLNDLLFGGGQRVSQRYLLMGVFILYLGTFLVIIRVIEFRKFLRPFIWTSLAGGLFQVVSIINLEDINTSFSTLKSVNKARSYDPKMKFVMIPYQKYPAPAYAIVLNNFASILGFAPIPYPKYVSKRFLESKPKYLTPYFFLRDENGSDLDPKSDCVKNSYFTQTKIKIDVSCPEKLSLLLTNIYKDIPIDGYDFKLSKNEGIQLYKKRVNK